LNRRSKNSSAEPARITAAAQFGITREAFEEIGLTVNEDLSRHARDLVASQRPATEMHVASHSRKTLRPCQYDDWARSFGRSLALLLFPAFESYIDLLTETIISHRRDNRPVDGKLIFSEAVRWCAGFEQSEECRTWLYLAFGRVGSSGAQLGPAEWEAFREALKTWRIVCDGARFSTLEKHAERMIAHKMRLAPENAGPVGRGNRPPKLTAREMKILQVIQQDVKGLQYCRELDHASIAPKRTGVWKDAARKYVQTYCMGALWRHRIEDEKSKILRKARLLELAGEKILPANKSRIKSA
jgi:hypothetical protein